jgi:hypothetical protein
LITYRGNHPVARHAEVKGRDETRHPEIIAKCGEYVPECGSRSGVNYE